jgi:surface antigen
MDTKLLAFIHTYLGVPNVGTNAVNRGQCVGLIEVWLAALGLPFIGGNAKDLPGNADPAHYRVVKNGPNNFPPVGAVVCWDASWGAGYGHTAIVVAATAMYLAVFEQNDPTGAAPVVSTHGYQGVEGWILAK